MASIIPIFRGYQHDDSLMAYTVFFKEAKAVFTAKSFIGEQPASHRALLQLLTDMLAKDGRIAHPMATKTSAGEWSVLLQEDNGDVYTYTLFISPLEQEGTNEKIKMPGSATKGELVIIDPSGPRDSAGGYHPGYWTISHYASLMEEEQRKVFLATVEHINNGTASSDYSVNEDSSVNIHIHRQGKAYAFTITGRAIWVSG